VSAIVRHGRAQAAGPLGRAATATAWGLAAWGVAQLAGAFLGRLPLALGMAQAAIAEWCAGRIGITWSDPARPAPTAAAVARRVGQGAALGAGAAVLTAAAALAARGASLVRAEGGALVDPSGSLAAIGLLACVVAAMRDELLLRGVALKVTRGLLPDWASLLACGAVAAAARFGVAGAVDASLVGHALRAVALGGLWIRDRGVWVAWAANAAWMWTVGPLARGGLVDLRFVAEPDAAVTTWVVLSAAALASAVVLRPRAESRLSR